MHYRNGREAKNGDPILQFGEGGTIQAAGVLHGATPGNDHCNGDILSTQRSGAPTVGACLCDCLHQEDVAAIMKEKGLDKRPPGK